MKQRINIVEKDGGKHIDGEEVLCEYDLDVSYIKELLFFFRSSYFLYVYEK